MVTSSTVEYYTYTRSIIYKGKLFAYISKDLDNYNRISKDKVTKEKLSADGWFLCCILKDKNEYFIKR